MATSPFVSCIIVFRNAEEFLEEAIESVFRQKYKNWELILVDDGSTDQSGSITTTYAERYPGKVICLEHPGRKNRGISASRNLAIRHAGGKYIAFLDADDLWMDRKLDEQVEIMESHPRASMICGASEHWRTWQNPGNEALSDEIVPVGASQDTIVEPPVLLKLLFPLGSGTPPSTSNLMARKEDVLRVGGFEDRFRGLYEDQVFKTRMYASYPIYVSSAVWDRYRQRADSIVNRAVSTGQYDFVRKHFFNWLAQYLSDHKVEDPEILQALSRELFPYRHPHLYRMANWFRGLRKRSGDISRDDGPTVLPESTGENSARE